MLWHFEIFSFFFSLPSTLFTSSLNDSAREHLVCLRIQRSARDLIPPVCRKLLGADSETWLFDAKRHVSKYFQRQDGHWNEKRKSRISSDGIFFNWNTPIGFPSRRLLCGSRSSGDSLRRCRWRASGCRRRCSPPTSRRTWASSTKPLPSQVSSPRGRRPCRERLVHCAVDETPSSKSPAQHSPNCALLFHFKE